MKMPKTIFYLLVLVSLFNCSKTDTVLPECKIHTLYEDRTERMEQRTLKGHVLFSWKRGKFWHYALVPNLNSRPASENVSEIGSIVSEDCLKQNLSYLAIGEEIFWIRFWPITSLEGNNLLIQQPPDYIVTDIAEYCNEVELELIIE